MRRGWLVVAAAVLAAGCGSTVPPQLVNASGSLGPAGDAGLTAPNVVATSAGTAPPAGALPGSAGGVPTQGTAPNTAAVDGTGTPPPAVTNPSTGTARPGRITAPLKIGLTYINNQQASASLGANDPRTNSVKTVTEAYVKAINAAGGLAGRKLEAVEYEWHSGDGSWSTAASAACAKFTQDNHVSVVLDEAFGTVGGFRDCLQKAGVFDITNQTVGDAVASANAPLYAGVGALTLDRAYAAVLTQEVRSGYLGKTNHLGIVLEGCPDNQRAYARTLGPLVKRLGLAPPKLVTFDCVDSTAGGAAQGQAAISNAILRFRQPPTVDRVMFVSAQESAVLLLFGASAQSQNYHPGYLLSSNAQAHLFTEGGSGFPSPQLPQLHGVGNSPYTDISAARATATDARCLALIRPIGINPGNYDDRGQAVFTCGPFLLLEAALQRTRGDASASGLAAAVAGLGNAFAAPDVLAGSTSYSSSRRDGGDLVQTFGYVSSCRCIRYSGQPAHAPR
ncbi:MAG TPA: hypothetical protein VFT62_10460 [Mycobacteriales bacterium]|nr:hypothetical protein [Mycobacteriales bacterium]